VFITVTIDFDGSGHAAVTQSGGAIGFYDEVYGEPLETTGNACLSTAANSLLFTTTLQIYAVAFDSVGDGATLQLAEASGAFTSFGGVAVSPGPVWANSSFSLNPVSGVTAAVGKDVRRLKFIGGGDGILFDNVAITMRVS